jgi:hypothetical protein
LRPGAPLSPGLKSETKLRPGAPLVAGPQVGVRPGAPLSPGLTYKTPTPRQWFTSMGQLSAGNFAAPAARFSCQVGALPQLPDAVRWAHLLCHSAAQDRGDLAGVRDRRGLAAGGGRDLLQVVEIP